MFLILAIVVVVLAFSLTTFITISELPGAKENACIRVTSMNIEAGNILNSNF